MRLLGGARARHARTGPATRRSDTEAAAARLLAEARDRGLPLWLDSGSLLGLVRDGRLPPWDKDVDLGAHGSVRDEVGRLARSIARSFGLRTLEKRFDGETYALLLLPQQRPGRPIAIHYFEPGADDLYTSVQPHLLLAENGRFAQHVLDDPGLRHDEDVVARSERCVRLRAWHVDKPIIAGLRAVDQLSRRSGVSRRHHAERFPTRGLYVLLRWEVPASHFAQLTSARWADQEILVPDRLDTYLERRYGTTWRTPRTDWFYALDDGCIVLA